MGERTYLDFEKPLEELDGAIKELEARQKAEKSDLTGEIQALENKRDQTAQTIYSRLSRWDKYQISRHPQRPYALDYINLMLTDFTELHGDRFFGDDQALVGGLARLEGEPLVVIGQQKGRNTKENLKRNFGLTHPEGFRKALRLMKLAGKFQRPILTLVDTPGAFPGLASEQRSVSEAIARNLFEMARIPTPIVVAIIGEGASGGALGIGVGDRILMLENSWYSVINPESCSLILWRNRDKKTKAAEAMKITALDLKELQIIDAVVAEPLGGAHNDHKAAAGNLKEEIQKAFSSLREYPRTDLVRMRVEKFRRMGFWDES